ncbi:MAG: NYN domain-containing protein [Chloroflexota bacterium]|nr:NYN domain-containing protein [Chloroflexota bacterium]
MGRLLIDGYNVIRRDPHLRALESQDPLAARSELIRLLRHNSVSRYQVIVVFDGTPPPAERKPPRGVKLIHSRGQTADELIAGLSGSGDIVVTDDRGLAADTLPAGPRLWSVEKLLNTVRPHGKAGRRTENVTEQPPILNPPRLRSFDVCSRCLFNQRDDWAMLCEEDSSLGRPRNFREQW